MPVNFEREDFKKIRANYRLIEDCLGGETVIKKSGELYLPRPNAADTSKENQARYQAYKNRAVFYGVTGRTLSGLRGQVFARDPLIELPNTLDLLKEDCTGLGVSLTQLSKEGVDYALAYGRGGFLTDYPATDENGVALSAVRSGEIAPTINVYSGKDIINWRTGFINGKEQLTLVVLRETYETYLDIFSVKLETQYRALILDESGYRQELYMNVDKAPSTFYPRKPSGEVWREIPFAFFGSVNNDPMIDPAPLYDLASLNIAHYRNSADYEESSFMAGQPTLVLSGLTEHWATNVLSGKIEIGSRAAVMLPENASAALIQAAPNTMPFEAMQHKERQMVALGAKLVEQRQVQRTAREADAENAAETSVLGSAASNVGTALTAAVKWAGEFEGTDEGARKKTVFKLSTEFDLLKLSPEDRKQVIAEWVQGAITFGEMRAMLRRGGIATEDDKQAMQSIRTDHGDIDEATEDDDNDPENDDNDPDNDNVGNA